MDPGVTGGIAAAIVVPIVLRWLGRRFPAVLSPKERAKSFDDLKHTYQKWERAGLGVMFLVALSGGVFWWWLLCAVADWRFAAFGHAPYALVPGRIIWGTPAVFLGILCAWRPTSLFYRVCLKGRYAEFLTYQKLKAGFDATRWEWPLYLVFGSLCVAFVALALDSYVLFAPNEMIVNDFWRLGPRTYSYRQTRTIRASTKMEAPNGNLVDRWTFVIEFDDGLRWSSRWDPSGAGEARLREIAEYVARQSGRTIQALPVLRRGDQ